MMARAKSYELDSLLGGALRQFWTHGYHATSLDDLVRVTGTSRHALYAEFGSKHGLFLACLDQYRSLIVDPAFGAVERPGSTIDDIAGYFAFQIGRAEAGGLPGPGCFLANSASEVAPHDAEVRAIVSAHNSRLEAGFAQALRQSAGRRRKMSDDRIDALGRATLAFANGLWTLSRTTAVASALQAAADAFLDTLQGELTNAGA
jgi:TetR/AcrR family transcriptional regulator, transcriptional repressor for nem operon